MRLVSAVFLVWVFSLPTQSVLTSESFIDWEGGDTTIPSPRGGHRNSSLRGWDYMISYMVGKLASNPTNFTRV